MPREAVRLIAAREPVPGWWLDLYTKRQSELRNRICDWLRRAGRPMTRTELNSAMSGTWAVEMQHALDMLTAQGTLRTSAKEGRGPGISTKTYTYYGLTEAK